jgi:hypothetical protein
VIVCRSIKKITYKKLVTGLAINPKIGDDSVRLNTDFRHTMITPQVSCQKTQYPPGSPAEYTEADVISTGILIIPTNPHCISNAPISAVLAENLTLQHGRGTILVNKQL